jgi:hypothetical protein
MNNDEIALSKFVVNKVLEIAQACVDENKKGWFVTMQPFHNALDGFDFTAKEVCAAVAFLEARTYVILFPDEDGHVTRISIVPQRYQCGHCKMWLNMEDDPENHIELCLRLQRKMERNRVLPR